MMQKMDYLTFITAGIRNRPGRNLATVFCFAFIAANIFSGQFLMSGAKAGVDRGVSRMGADQILVPQQYLAIFQNSGLGNTLAIVKVEPSAFRFRADVMNTIGKVPGVSTMSPQLFVSTLELPDLSESPVDVFGIDPETDFTIQPWLRRPLEKPLGPGEVIIGDQIAGDVASRISLFGRTYTVAGRLDPTQSSVDHTIFLRLDDAYTLAALDGIVPPSQPRISPGDINAVLVRDAPGEDSNAVVVRIKKFFVTVSLKNTAVIGRHFTLNPVSQDVRGIPALLNSISFFVVTASLPLIALIAAMVAHERQREIGLLISIGAKRSVVFFLVFAESLVLAVIGGIAGAGAAMVTFFLLNMQGLLSSALQVSFRMPTLSELGVMTGIVLLVVIAIGSVASLWPAYHTSTMNPYEAIRQEGQ